MSRLDYGCQLWSPYLIKPVISRETSVLKLYSLQRRRERYIIIYVWKILEGLVPNLSLLHVLKNRIVEGGPVSRHT